MIVNYFKKSYSTSFWLKTRSENRILFYFSTFVICALWQSRSYVRLSVFRKSSKCTKKEEDFEFFCLFLKLTTVYV